MPRRPGVSFYRGHFVTKFGCGDGPPVKLAVAKGKSDRDAKQAAETELVLGPALRAVGGVADATVAFASERARFDTGLRKGRTGASVKGGPLGRSPGGPV
jgi:hypothetical protein